MTRRIAHGHSAQPIFIPRPEHLFVLDDAIFAAMNTDDINAMFEDMVAHRIAHIPFPSFSIRAGGATWFHKGESFFDKETLDDDPELLSDIRSTIIDFEFPTGGMWEEKTDELYHWAFSSERFDWDDYFDQCSDEDEFVMADYAYELLKTLIVVLATRNAEKSTKERKSLALGIGSRKQTARRYVTTIRIGALEHVGGEGSSGGTHASPRAHWRRGHLRRVHYGENREQIRTVFIEAVFVNADHDYVPREHYTVKPANSIG